MLGFDRAEAACDYRARYYDPADGRFLNEDPIGFDGGLNFYAYVGNHPADFTDPSGLAKSPAQCAEILKQIEYLAALLANEIAKYNPMTDGAGGPNWTQGGHYIEMTSYVTGIMNNAADYCTNCRRCDGNPVITPNVWQLVKRFQGLPRPIIPRDQMPVPDELINWYNPSLLERFNNFMNHHFGHAPAPGVQPLPGIQQLLHDLAAAGG